MTSRSTSVNLLLVFTVRKDYICLKFRVGEGDDFKMTCLFVVVVGKCKLH